MIDRLKDLFASLSPQPTGPVEYIVAGLGNPGREYEHTRHNAGFLALDHIAAKKNAKVTRIKFKSLCGDCELGGKRALLLKPTTFMNLSGEAVRDAMQFYKVPSERLIVLFDDVTLPPGALRIRRKGSDGGHNGMKNIIYLTGHDDFPRVKIGVGAKPHRDMDLADWVLSRFTDDDAQALRPVLDDALTAVELIIRGDITEAMNRFNGSANRSKE